jgi:hypothetical protein
VRLQRRGRKRRREELEERERAADGLTRFVDGQYVGVLLQRRQIFVDNSQLLGHHQARRFSDG